MVVFRDAIDDFRVVVWGGVRTFLAGQGKNDASIVAPRSGKLVGLLACSDFETGPFAPEINAGGGFDDVGNVGAADAGGDFDEIKFAVGVLF